MSLRCPLEVYQYQIFTCNLTVNQIPKSGPLVIKFSGNVETKTMTFSNSAQGYIRESFSTQEGHKVSVYITSLDVNLSAVVNGKLKK